MLHFSKKHNLLCKCSLLFAALCFHIFICSNSNNLSNIISAQEETDLDLFSSSNNRASVFSKLNKTETLYGKSALKNILKNPLSDIEQLNERQIAIKKLVDEITLFEALDKELQQFKTGETAIRSFLETEDLIRKAALDEFFFKTKFLKKLNDSPTALNVGQMLHVINLSFPLAEHLILHFFLSKTLKKKLGITDCCSKKKSDHEHEDEHHTHAAPPLPSLAVYNTYNIVHLLIHCIGLKALIGHVYQKVNLIKELQIKLIDVSKCIKSLKNIYTLITPQTTINKSLPHYSNLEKLFTNFNGNTTDVEISVKFDRLVSLLSQSTFTGKASCFSNYGAILSANNLIKQIKNELSAGLKAMGSIDAYMSIARLYEQSAETLGYSFAKYIENSNPFIEAEGFWNPLQPNPTITKRTTDLEHLDLGMNNPAHMIITGPNAAGKSTKLKSIALLTLLGQTITVVPATSFKFTPFSRISIFIRHADDLTTGESLLTNEMNKANDLAAYLKDLPQNQFCFIVFDELFKSTSFEFGQKSAIKLMDYISNFKNTLSITATHFPLITTLADKKPGYFKNYNAQVLKDELGHLNFLFKEGISNERNAFTVLNMRNIGYDWNN